MNVYIDHYRWPSLAIERIKTNLRKYAPPDFHRIWDFNRQYDADLLILIVVGRRDHALAKMKEIKAVGKKYAVIQLSMLSTRNKKPEDWLELWQGAEVVWSYYNLPGKFNFYYTPLGANPEIFYPLNLEHKYSIALTGGYTRAECLGECYKAAKLVNKPVLRIKDATDEELNYSYNQCDYINGLRHKEGFELPAAEGLLCGIRPILFDTPIFRQWYDGLAEFIPEGSYQDVVDNLVKIFSKEIKPVTQEEIEEAKQRFNWERIIKGFWERCL